MALSPEFTMVKEPPEEGDAVAVVLRKGGFGFAYFIRDGEDVNFIFSPHPSTLPLTIPYEQLTQLLVAGRKWLDEPLTLYDELAEAAARNLRAQESPDD